MHLNVGATRHKIEEEEEEGSFVLIIYGGFRFSVAFF